jgi:hypothetical protein
MRDVERGTTYQTVPNHVRTNSRVLRNTPWTLPDIEAFMRSPGDPVIMSQATKVVLGTVGLSAVLVVLTIAVLAFG